MPSITKPTQTRPPQPAARSITAAAQGSPGTTRPAAPAQAPVAAAPSAATQTPTDPDPYAAALEEANTAWAAFVAAVRAQAPDIVPRFVAHLVASKPLRDAAGHPYSLPAAPGPAYPTEADWRRLTDQHDWLNGWAGPVRSGYIEGTAASGDSVRPITAAERAEYERRAAAYRAELAAYHAACATFETHHGREPTGHPGPNQHGWARPAMWPAAPPPGPMRMAPAAPGVATFDQALALALAGG